MPKRRRRLFGATVEAMGRRARATPVGSHPEKALEQRERQEKVRRLTSAGKNKGEEKGYGATAPTFDPAEPDSPST